MATPSPEHFEDGAVIIGGFRRNIGQLTPEETRDLINWLTPRAAKPGEPIATAPLDRMVLTDCGCAIYQDHKDTAFWMCKPGWFTCTPEGNIYEDPDDGILSQRVDPATWMEFPL